MPDLPEAVLRFDARHTDGGTMPGAVRRCVVVIDGKDVAELQISDLRYEQEGAIPGKWWVSLFADPEEPLSRTMRVW